MTPREQAQQLAADGYGWEDLTVMTGIAETEAREIVWTTTHETNERTTGAIRLGSAALSSLRRS